MARKNESPQKAAMREMMGDYLKDNDISVCKGNDDWRYRIPHEGTL